MTAGFLTLLCIYAAGNYPLVDRGHEPSVLWAMTLLYVVGLLLYLRAFALAFISVAASLALIVVLALVFVLPEPFDRSKNDRRGAVR